MMNELKALLFMTAFLTNLESSLGRIQLQEIAYVKAFALFEKSIPVDVTRDLILGRRCTQHQTCNALSGHSLSLLLGGVPVNPRC